MVDVTVDGSKSACVEIMEPAISRQGNEFIAVLPGSEDEFVI
jgi:hypothetical protein